jgi:hypothetical protein
MPLYGSGELKGLNGAKRDANSASTNEIEPKVNGVQRLLDVLLRRELETEKERERGAMNFLLVSVSGWQWWVAPDDKK